MARLPQCMYFPLSRSSSGALSKGRKNLHWLRGRYQIRGMYPSDRIGSQEVVGGAPRYHGLTGPGTGIELEAAQG